MYLVHFLIHLSCHSHVPQLFIMPLSCSTMKMMTSFDERSLIISWWSSSEKAAPRVVFASERDNSANTVFLPETRQITSGTCYECILFPMFHRELNIGDYQFMVIRNWIGTLKDNNRMIKLIPRRTNDTETIHPRWRPILSQHGSTSETHQTTTNPYTTVPQLQMSSLYDITG